MKNTPLSQSSTVARRSTIELLVPTWVQLFLYLVISLIILFGFNVRNAWDYLNPKFLANGGLSSILGDKTQNVDTLFHSVYISTGLQVLFWGFVGCACYVLLWFARSVLTNIYNDVVADTFVHPKSYSRAGYWGSVISRKVTFVSMVIVLVAYSITGYRLIDVLARWSDQAIMDYKAAHSLPILLGALLGTMVMLHFFILLIHVTASSWRFIYRGL